MDTAKHEIAIQSAIRDLWPTVQGGDGVWTRLTFEALRVIGRSFGYKSRYSEKYGGPGEWLWDFAWYERDPISKNILSHPLVAESEWTLKNVRYDFEKLLAASAPLRLIILQGATEDQLIDKINELESCSLAYHGIKARYLAAGWVYKNPKDPTFKSWTTGRASIDAAT